MRLVQLLGYPEVKNKLKVNTKFKISIQFQLYYHTVDKLYS